MKGSLANGRRRIPNTAWESRSGRIRKKLLGRTMWYKSRILSKESPGRGKKHKKVRGGKSNTELKTRAVLFLEQTPHGQLGSKACQKQFFLKIIP